MQRYALTPRGFRPVKVLAETSDDARDLDIWIANPSPTLSVRRLPDAVPGVEPLVSELRELHAPTRISVKLAPSGALLIESTGASLEDVTHMACLVKTLTGDQPAKPEGPTYPRVIDPHLFQYGDGLFVWFDETGAVGGATGTEQEAQTARLRYGQTLDGTAERFYSESELAKLLPGTCYMDEPDGGAPSVFEQLERMAKDAASWREHAAATPIPGGPVPVAIPYAQRTLDLDLCVTPYSREKRIYVSGPMSGLPDHNFPAFNAAAKDLRGSGWVVINPADHGLIAGAEWADYLRLDIAQMATCSTVYLLPGWSNSKGAQLEVHIAKALGMSITLDKDAESHIDAPRRPMTQDDMRKVASWVWDAKTYAAMTSPDRIYAGSGVSLTFAALTRLLQLADVDNPMAGLQGIKE